MPTLENLIISIRDQAIGQIGTDDTKVQESFVEKLIRDKRSLLINSQAKNGLGVDQAYYQVVDCLEIICGTVNCPGIPRGYKYHYVETKKIESFKGSIAYLGLIDGVHPFSQIPLSAFLNHVPVRFGKEYPVFTVIDGKALLKSPPSGVAYLRGIMVLENPVEGVCEEDAYRAEYPVPNSIVHQLELLCLKQLFSTLPIQPDTTNDAVDRPDAVSRPDPNDL